MMLWSNPHDEAILGVEESTEHPVRLGFIASVNRSCAGRKAALTWVLAAVVTVSLLVLAAKLDSVRRRNPCALTAWHNPRDRRPGEALVVIRVMSMVRLVSKGRRQRRRRRRMGRGLVVVFLPIESLLACCVVASFRFVVSGGDDCDRTNRNRSGNFPQEPEVCMRMAYGHGGRVRSRSKGPRLQPSPTAK